MTCQSIMSATAERWDSIAVEGDIKAKDCSLRYRRDGRVLAVASIYRDLDSSKAEFAMEKGDGVMMLRNARGSRCAFCRTPIDRPMLALLLSHPTAPIWA